MFGRKNKEIKRLKEIRGRLVDNIYHLSEINAELESKLEKLIPNRDKNGKFTKK